MPRLLGIYVKLPQPGQVKTRLAAGVGETQAAEIYEAFVRDLTARFRSTADRRFLCYSPNTPQAGAWFRELGGGDYELWPQPAGSLTPRLREFFKFAEEQRADRVVVIGSDSPTIPQDHTEAAFAHLESRDCVLGPASDGGYYLLGLRKPLPIFDAIDWSTPRVLSQTVGRLSKIQATLALLPPWYDVDAVEDLEVLRGHLRALVRAGDPLIETLTHTLGALENIH